MQQEIDFWSIMEFSDDTATFGQNTELQLSSLKWEIKKM